MASRSALVTGGGPRSDSKEIRERARREGRLGVGLKGEDSIATGPDPCLALFFTRAGGAHGRDHQTSEADLLDS
jgi:hypothetical protein